MKYRKVEVIAMVRVDETEDFTDQAVAYEAVGEALLGISRSRRRGEQRNLIGVQHPLASLTAHSEPSDWDGRAV